MTPLTILNALSEVSGYSTDEIAGKCRERELVAVRQVYCYIAATKTGHSLKNIGRLIGGRDHTTVIHSRNKVDFYLKHSDPLAMQIFTALERAYPYLTPRPQQPRSTMECARPVNEVVRFQI